METPERHGELRGQPGQSVRDRAARETQQPRPASWLMASRSRVISVRTVSPIGTRATSSLLAVMSIPLPICRLRKRRARQDRQGNHRHSGAGFAGLGRPRPGRCCWPAPQAARLIVAPVKRPAPSSRAAGLFSVCGTANGATPARVPGYQSSATVTSFTQGGRWRSRSRPRVASPFGLPGRLPVLLRATGKWRCGGSLRRRCSEQVAARTPRQEPEKSDAREKARPERQHVVRPRVPQQEATSG